MKLPEENVANMLFDISLSNIFLDMSLLPREKKIGLHQTKNLL